MADAAGWVYLQTALVLASPLVLAAMGGLTSERSGVMNIALEGKMLTAACVTFLVSSAGGNALLGATAGILAAIMLSMFHAILTQQYRIDHIVSGMAINAIALGGTKFLTEKFGSSRDQTFAHFSVWAYVVAAIFGALALAMLIARTKWGLRLWAVGNEPEKCRQNGVDPVPVRYVSLVATGIFTGLGGVLIVTNAGQFNDGMTAGKGFIALAALILGGWKPLPVLLACLAFGLIEATQLLFQGGSIGLPPEFYSALPYLATLVALTMMRSQGRAPAGLGKA